VVGKKPQKSSVYGCIAKICYVILLPFLLIAHFSSHALVVGSNNAVAIEAFTSFPQTGTDNTMLGFGSFTNGFGLASASTTCTFNDLYPIGGAVDLNGGTLILMEDLYLNPQLSISSLGTIIGNNHCVVFSPQNQTVTWPSLGTMNMLNAQNTTANAPAINWSADGKYLAVGTTAQPGIEINVYSFNGSALTLAAKGVHLGSNVNSIAWQPTSTAPYYLAAGTNLGLYAYTFTPPNSLVATSTVNTGTRFQAVAWHPSGKIVAAGQISFTTQQVQIYNFNLGTLTTNTSYSFPPYCILYANSGCQDLDFDYTGSYLAVALQYSYPAGPSTMQILHWDGTSLVITSSNASWTGDFCTVVNWSPDGTYIAASYQVSKMLWIYSLNRTSSVLSNPYQSPAFSSYIVGLSWSHNGKFLAVGTGGSGYDVQIFAINPSLSLYNLAAQYTFTAGIYAVKWNYNDTILAASQGLSVVYLFNFLPGIMTFSNANIIFNSPAQLQTPMICSGNCIIYGNGYPFNLNSQILTVTSGSSLLFKDIVLEGINGTNLQCYDSSGTISFDNVTCMLSNTMQLTQGNFAIIGDCIMTGTGAFVYSSNQATTISSRALWYFDYGIAFSYYPQGGSTNLINFADNTAQLYLYSTNLHAASTGLHLTKGCLMIDGPCQFFSDGATETNGIWIGDGTSADDLKVKILPESGIVVEKGYVSYRNVH